MNNSIYSIQTILMSKESNNNWKTNNETAGIEPGKTTGDYETTLLTTRPTEQHNKNLNFGRLNILEKVNKINK